MENPAQSISLLKTANRLQATPASAERSARRPQNAKAMSLGRRLVCRGRQWDARGNIVRRTSVDGCQLLAARDDSRRRRSGQRIVRAACSRAAARNRSAVRRAAAARLGRITVHRPGMLVGRMHKLSRDGDIVAAACLEARSRQCDQDEKRPSAPDKTGSSQKPDAHNRSHGTRQRRRQLAAIRISAMPQRPFLRTDGRKCKENSAELPRWGLPSSAPRTEESRSTSRNNSPPADRGDDRNLNALHEGRRQSGHRARFLLSNKHIDVVPDFAALR